MNFILPTASESFTDKDYFPFDYVLSLEFACFLPSLLFHDRRRNSYRAKVLCFVPEVNLN